MRRRLWILPSALALACVFALGGQTSASAQGRGRGGGGGMGRGGGPPAGVGVAQRLARRLAARLARADTGRGNASDRSDGRSDAGLERARMQRDNARRADEDLRAHPETPSFLHTTANDLREGYRAALVSNPELKFGQYVAATRLAANLGARHPNVTREAILAGLAEGHSIGRTLRDLGLGSDEAKDAERRVEREIKESRRRS